MERASQARLSLARLICRGGTPWPPLLEGLLTLQVFGTAKGGAATECRPYKSITEPPVDSNQQRVHQRCSVSLSEAG
jgi:hypothetical protein